MFVYKKEGGREKKKTAVEMEVKEGLCCLWSVKGYYFQFLMPEPAALKGIMGYTIGVDCMYHLCFLF